MSRGFDPTAGEEHKGLTLGKTPVVIDLTRWMITGGSKPPAIVLNPKSGLIRKSRRFDPTAGEEHKGLTFGKDAGGNRSNAVEGRRWFETTG